MPQQVCMGAMMSCTFGAAPSSLVVLPINRVMTNAMPIANMPALNNTCKLNCMWGGVISISQAGQVTVDIA